MEGHPTKAREQEDSFVLVNTDRPDNRNVSEHGKEREVRVVMEQVQLEDDEDEDDSEVTDVEGDTDDLLVTLPDDTEDIDLIHARLTTLSNLRLPRFAGSLKRLCLRQNFLKDVEEESIAPLTCLEDLDLYDNQIKHVGHAIQCLPLRILDLSFNLLRSVPEVFLALHSLDTVYFVQNKITFISNLQNLTSLRSLELGGNRIRKIDNLDSLGNLEELWLGKNKIAKLENLQGLKKLKILSIQSNRITKLEGLEELADLQEIYLSHNGIERIEGLEKNFGLKVLDVTSNKIPKIENVSHLKGLTELWASDNKIPDVRDLEKELGSLAALETVYLEGNPCQKEDMVNYRRKVMLALPQLIQIDATYVKQ